MWQKEGGIKMTSKHKKYNLKKSNLYSIHGSKPNMGCEFDAQEQILIKLKYQFLFACPNFHMKQDWKHLNFMLLLHGPPLLLELYVLELLLH
jgi:hypothetical protein